MEAVSGGKVPGERPRRITVRVDVEQEGEREWMEFYTSSEVHGQVIFNAIIDQVDKLVRVERKRSRGGERRSEERKGE